MFECQVYRDVCWKTQIFFSKILSIINTSVFPLIFLSWCKTSTFISICITSMFISICIRSHSKIIFWIFSNWFFFIKFYIRQTKYAKKKNQYIIFDEISNLLIYQKECYLQRHGVFKLKNSLSVVWTLKCDLEPSSY